MQFGRSHHVHQIVQSCVGNAPPATARDDGSRLNRALAGALERGITGLDDIVARHSPPADEVPFLPLHRLISAEEVRDVEAEFGSVLRSGRFTSGSKVSEFEDEMSGFLGARVVGASSGTEALMAALTAVGVAEGDRVILPANSFAATENAVLAVGAVAVLCDVDEATHCLDPADFSRLASAGASCVVPVHLYGRRPDLRAIREIADANGMKVVDDACQSLGLQDLGEHAHATALSFNPYKNLGACGKAGAVLTSDAAVAETCEEYLYHGFRPGVKNFKTRRHGLNARLDNLQAAALLARMPRFSYNNLVRAALACRYGEALGNVAATGLLSLPPMTSDMVWHLYTVRVHGGHRDRVRKALLDAYGVETDVYYPYSTHRQGSRADIVDVAGTHLPATDRLDQDILQLPLHPDLTAAEQDRVVEGIWKVVGSL
ncbi:DegT/DnrJ/EryC1/StrS family aminotransferase [Saccharopolyspora cebuensis]|uniref:DegT/DnrJ/EryC1/StrS family aminotransferase n=1 Tax=Saccharopolyspora cebuensis TaxID=418759 RepID=A0ABV4CDD7_9PSEU